MSKKEELIKIKKLLAKALFNFEEFVDGNGITIIVDDKLEVGVNVYTYDEAGEKITAPDGDYTIADIGLVVVKDGVIAEIKPVEAETKTEAETETTTTEMEAIVNIADCWPIMLEDKTEVYIKGDKAYDKDGNPFADGTYNSIARTHEYKSTLTITGGIISEETTTSTSSIAMSDDKIAFEDLTKKYDNLLNIVNQMFSTIQSFGEQPVDDKSKTKQVDNVVKNDSKASKFFKQ